MEGWSREILTSDPRDLFPATECVEEQVQDVSAAESSGRKMFLLVNILRATLLPDFRCETSVVHLRQSTRIRPVAQTPAWNQEVAAYESHSDPFAARDAQMRDAQ